MRRIKRAIAVATLTAVVSGLLTAPTLANPGDTLAAVKERGALLCPGHNGSYLGMAEVDDKGKWRGFDIDLCRALATAIFGTHEGHLKIIPTSWAQRFPAIQSGDLDIIIKATGWTMGRDTDVNLQFSRPYMLAAQHFMTRKATGATSAIGLNGGSVCVQAGTTYERYAAEHAAANGYELEIIPFEKTEEVKAAYKAGRCDAIIDWDLQLAVFRNLEAADPDSHVILPDVVAVEPMAMAMRQGDDNWVDIANWLLSALIMADESGITSANVDEIKSHPPTPVIAKLLGATPGIGSRLGLDDDWVYNVIKSQGNYGEIWDRNLGRSSVYHLERGVNALVGKGGVFYSLVMD